MLGSNIVVKKNPVFLGLMKKFKTDDTVKHVIDDSQYISSLHFPIFKKAYTSLLSALYVFEFLGFHKNNELRNNITLRRLMKFYIKFMARHIMNLKSVVVLDQSTTYSENNLIVFSRPKKQLFLIIYKGKPIFIFTCGLMRMIMGEDRKSSKNMYKVAMSLIKLSTIIMHRKKYFTSGVLKLNNTGHLKPKILNMFRKYSSTITINYVIFKVRSDISSQKWRTRRSVKKYVKKRFKLN